MYVYICLFLSEQSMNRSNYVSLPLMLEIKVFDLD